MGDSSILQAFRNNKAFFVTFVIPLLILQAMTLFKNLAGFFLLIIGKNSALHLNTHQPLWMFEILLTAVVTGYTISAVFSEPLRENASLVIGLVIFQTLLLVSFRSTLNVLRNSFVYMHAQNKPDVYVYNHQTPLFRLFSMIYYYILTYARLLGLGFAILIGMYMLQLLFLSPVLTRGFLSQHLARLREGFVQSKLLDTDAIFSFFLGESFYQHVMIFLTGLAVVLFYAVIFVMPMPPPPTCSSSPAFKNTAAEANRVMHGYVLAASVVLLMYLLWMILDIPEATVRITLIACVAVGWVLSWVAGMLLRSKTGLPPS
jgi:hypothetical protein